MGGHAVANVSRVNQENALATYHDVVKRFFPLLKIKPTDAEVLGSVGKKTPGATSGDIDIAVSAPAFLRQKGILSYNDIADTIVAAAKRSGLEYKDMRSIGIVSIAWPIANVDGKQAGQKVQTDFMIVPDTQYSKWAYYSPNYLESTYSGYYRNKLLMAIAKHAGFKVLDTHKETGEPIKWERNVLSLDKGLDRGVQTNISAKTGKVTKSTTMLSRENISKDPDAIIATLFGPGFKAKNILTWEQAFRALMSNSFPHKKERDAILKETAQALNDINVPIPPELEAALKKK